ncbi:hypothetical protein K1T71_007045 [Dendrolimus kikuchii]|uniref:Uncharacterized protein n=1 Tax=Dendrolimus kikuchii TaxID=765133 RepID=A0ACC1CZM3_9NEOP|nr:hypothetical protein K1T71_007045 [Dendrolimus kikuchii]
MSYGRPPPRIDGMVSLKVDNLTYRTTPEDLRRVFERCGEVGDIYIPRDRYTRESRGFAFVRFYDRRDAEEALDSLDGRMLDGRELRPIRPSPQVPFPLAQALVLPQPQPLQVALPLRLEELARPHPLPQPLTLPLEALRHSDD